MDYGVLKDKCWDTATMIWWNGQFNSVEFAMKRMMVMNEYSVFCNLFYFFQITSYEMGIIAPVFSNQRPSCHFREDEQHDILF